MESLSNFQLQRTLSIQSCFPERNSNPPSENVPHSNNSGITSNPSVSVLQLANFFNYQTAAPPTNIPNRTSMHSIPARTQAHPSSLLDGPALERTTSTNLAKYVPLYHAALKGDWEKAKEFFSQHPQAINERITNGWETVLHIAAGAKHIIFVEELVELMDPLDLALKNKSENTALCFAVASGITKIAELMVAKNGNLPNIRGSKGVTPLHMAALLGYKDMVRFLVSVTDQKSLTEEDCVGLLIATISSDLYDIALEILFFKPIIAIKRDPNGETALHVLARRPLAFSGKSELGIWQRCVYNCVSAKQWSQSGRTSTFRLFDRVMNLMGIQEVIEKKFMQSQALELVKCLWKEVIFLLDDSKTADLIRSPS